MPGDLGTSFISDFDGFSGVSGTALAWGAAVPCGAGCGLAAAGGTVAPCFSIGDAALGSGPRWGGGSGLAAAGAAVAPLLSLVDAGLGSCTGGAKTRIRTA
ncbi:hypothetical protein, partial [Mesorhizobium sp.]|uniref:hypothetical protein n=1 Tax=Mesorhizobium sp. TaxID=1871066 RepID=UPI0025BF67B8